MKRRILFPMLIGVALAVTISADSAEACVFRRLVGRRPARCRIVKQTSQRRPAAKTWSAFPTRAWDLGNKMGKWPPYYGD